MRIERGFKITGHYETSCVNAPYRKQKPNVPNLDGKDIPRLIDILERAGVMVDKSASTKRFKAGVGDVANTVEMGLEERTDDGLNSSEIIDIVFSSTSLEIYLKRVYSSKSQGGYGGTTQHEEGIVVNVVYSGPDCNEGTFLIEMVQETLNDFYQRRVEHGDSEGEAQFKYLLEEATRRGKKKELGSTKTRGERGPRLEPPSRPTGGRRG